MVLTTFFVILKLFTRRGYVKLDDDLAALQTAIEYLKQPKREQRIREEERRSNVALTGSSGATLNNVNEHSPDSSHEEREV